MNSNCSRSAASRITFDYLITILMTPITTLPTSQRLSRVDIYFRMNICMFPENSLSTCNEVIPEALACIIFKKGRYWLYHARDFNETEMIHYPYDQIWISLKKPNKHIFKDRVTKYGYKIKAGDIIRFGRVRFFVRKISSEQENNQISSEILDNHSSVETDKKSSNEDEQLSQEIDNQFDNDNCNTFGAHVQNKNILCSSPRITFQNAVQHGQTNQEVVNNLRKSIDSSLLFESQNESQLNKILNKKQRFSQMKIKKKQISLHTDLNDSDSVCRICLDGEDSENPENPMISPCQCTGSMKNVHLECLKMWIHDKRNTRTLNNTRSFNWNNLKCELCKTIYNDEFYYKN